jgi:hypothetical protein
LDGCVLQEIEWNCLQTICAIVRLTSSSCDK